MLLRLEMEMKDQTIRRAFSCAIIMFLMSQPAFADRLDGGWCGGGGKQLQIDGPNITTPSGTVMQGDYQRHSFSYTAPAGDADAGQQIHMQQLNDEQMNLYRMIDGKPGEPELWQRCDITS